MNTKMIITSRNQTTKIFYPKMKIKNFFYVGENLVTFETNDKEVIYSSDPSFNDNNYPFAYGEKKIYFMLLWKYIPIQEYSTSTKKRKPLLT